MSEQKEKCYKLYTKNSVRFSLLQLHNSPIKIPPQTLHFPKLFFMHFALEKS